MILKPMLLGHSFKIFPNLIVESIAQYINFVDTSCADCLNRQKREYASQPCGNGTNF